MKKIESPCSVINKLDRFTENSLSVVLKMNSILNIILHTQIKSLIKGMKVFVRTKKYFILHRCFSFAHASLKDRQTDAQTDKLKAEKHFAWQKTNWQKQKEKSWEYKTFCWQKTKSKLRSQKRHPRRFFAFKNFWELRKPQKLWTDTCKKLWLFFSQTK